ncbi:MAG: hypothetical protein WKF30_00685 [Pyrinomonadaceae bacterium]
MSEEPTQDLPRRSFEERVLAELASINMRLTNLDGHFTTLERKMDALDGNVDALVGKVAALESKVDARLHDTRPIWESVQVRLGGIENTLEDMNGQMRLLVADLFQMRARVFKLEDQARVS